MKILKGLTFILIFLGLVSCLDELPEVGNENFCPGVRLDDGTCPGADGRSTSSKISGWDFSKASDYSFNSNFVEINSGKASLKEIDTEFSGSDFSSGSHMGTSLLSDKLQMKAGPTDDENHVNTILPSRSSSLIGYWRFEDNWNDSSEKSNHLTANSMTFSSLSKTGNSSASFSPSSLSHLTASSSSEFISSSSDSFSLFTWVNPTAITGVTSNANRILSLHRGATSGSAFAFGLGSNDKILFYNHADTSWSIINADIELNIWTHIGIVYNGSCFQVYKNGAQIGSCLTKSIIAGGSFAAYIGDFKGTDNISYDGKMDDFVFWREDLTEAEVFKLYEAQSSNYTQLSSSWTPRWENIIGYWKMDGNWHDSSGNEKHGVPQNNAKINSEDHYMGSGAGEFGGGGEYVDISTIINDYTNINKGTISLWFNNQESTFSDSSRAFWINAEGGDNVGMGPRSNGSFTAFIKTSYYRGVSYSLSELGVGIWNHLVMSWDLSENHLFFYVNGKEVASSSVLPTLSAEVTKRADISSASGNSLVGLLDDVTLWSVSLNENEVKLIYNRQKQKYASSYESTVLDLASSQDIINLSKTTDLPFMKELTTTSESSLHYTSLSGDLSNGLVGYYNLNNNVSDSSNEGNNGSLSGGLYQKEGLLGDSVLFMNSNSRLNFTTLHLDMKEEEGSVSGWMYRDFEDSTTNNRFVMDLGPVGNFRYQENIDRWRWVHTNSVDIRVDADTIAQGQWTHFILTWSTTNSRSRLYINGAIVNTDVGPDSTGALTEIVFGGDASLDNSQLYGALDELAIWKREITEGEALETYRRGANRIKYQVRTCSDSTCSTDPEWKGPGGDGTTYFSELYNRSSADISSMFSSCDSSGDNLCSADEFSFTGATQRVPYKFDFVDSLINNYSALNTRYFQYRVLMEAEENTACGGEPCLPSVTAINFETANDYYDISPSVTSTTPITISKEITKVEETVSGGCSVKYQFSSDGTNFSYYNSGSWTSATDTESQANTVGQISSTLKDFINSGSLYVRAYLTSNGTQSCELQNLTITQ